MADFADAIAAAEKAAHDAPATTSSALQQPSPAQDVPPAPQSPTIKPEPNVEDTLMTGAEEQRPSSPLKRSRSPHEHADMERPEEKRLKTEIVETFSQNDEADIDEFARLVQQAQDSVMHDDYIQLENDPLSSAGDFLDSAAVSIHDLEEALMSMTPVRTESIWNGTHHFTRRKHILPALGCLAVDILVAWSEQSLEDTIRTLCQNRDSDVAKEYACLKNAFDAQRKCLSEDTLLLDPYGLGVYDGDREIVRIANLAASCASLFSTLDIGLEEVNDQFLMIFIPQGHDLGQDTAEIWLALKTQIFLAMLDGQHERTRDEILEEVFPAGLKAVIESHHLGWPLNSTETQFLAEAEARKAMLRNESNDADSIQALSKQFSYETFLDSLNTYINDNIESIKMQGAGIIELRPGFEHGAHHDGAGPELDFDFDLDAAIAEASRAAETDDPNNGTSNDDDLTAFLTEGISKATQEANRDDNPPGEVSQAAESASKATMMALEQIQQSDTPAQNSQPAQPSSTQVGCPPQQVRHPQQYYPYPQHNNNNINPHSSYRSPGDHLPPNQSDSTPALYERARQAAAARSSTQTRREGTHSTRRPWSPEEEKALMMGLDMVKGPHWSQILGLFGPNGSISQILADRTQVQLKDKARNLKLFFLKANTEMPYYLQCVTGELKTRAPTQAARKEAEEKAKEEQQAHVGSSHILSAGGQTHAAHTQHPVARPSATIPNAHSTSSPQKTQHPHTQASPTNPHNAVRPQIPVTSAQPRPPFLAAQPVQLPIKMLQQQQPARTTSPVAPPPAAVQPTPQTSVSDADFSLTSTDATPQEDLSIEDAALMDLKALLGGVPDDFSDELVAASSMDLAPTDGNASAQSVLAGSADAIVKQEQTQDSLRDSQQLIPTTEVADSGHMEKEEPDFLLDLQAAIDKEASQNQEPLPHDDILPLDAMESETDLFDIQAAIEREAAQHAAQEDDIHDEGDTSMMEFQLAIERETPASVTPYRATSSTTA